MTNLILPTAQESAEKTKLVAKKIAGKEKKNRRTYQQRWEEIITSTILEEIQLGKSYHDFGDLTDINFDFLTVKGYKIEILEEEDGKKYPYVRVSW